MATVDSDETTRLVLVRHGESVVTVNQVIGGHRTCTGLSPLGRAQSERLRDRLERTGEFEGAELLSSHFARAIETAQIIGPAIVESGDASFEQLADFGEHDPGPELDGMSFDAYVERFGTPDWNGDPHVEIFPGGETMFEFHRRVRRGLDELIASRRGTVVLACHGGVVDATFRHLIGSPMTGGFELRTLNTSLTEFVSIPGGRWRVERYNDAAHLEGLPTATPRET